ncbi:MAG: TIR domain-containing protein, partial [Rhodospirillaceae bacterium]|nr:TIR domain-containing protein [Rhodospirillaceae bacterium]
MRAFLSHSSIDKGYVESVTTLLRPGTYELDSQTFDLGSINSQAILSALERCDLFCLFLSSQSVNSAYVDFETLLGIEFFASGRASRFLAICLDEKAFQVASSNVKHFNIVRHVLQPEGAARLIEGHLVSLATEHSAQHHVFMGRENELKELGQQITDHSRPASKALYVSGNFGSGRRTIARKIYRDYFPHVGQVLPTIFIDPFAGLDELYRTVLAALHPTMRASELLELVETFTLASCDERTRIVARELNALLPAREAVIVFDNGGLLTDSGSLVPEF